jgi:lyso-ornithine lipid O-acyltransferase
MMKPRSLLRMLRILAHLAAGGILALYIRTLSRTGRRPPWIAAVVRRWHKQLCDILGIRVRVGGHLNPRCLLIGNHISWLDIPVIGAQGEIVFLSKADVRRWPLIGWLAEVAGTHFIERGANRIRELSEVLRRDIVQGRTLMIFPEGTTSNGTSVLRFHPRLFALAQETGLAIQPVALAYHRSGENRPDVLAPYIGEDKFLAHLLRVVGHPDLVAEVRFLPPMAIEEGTPRDLLARTSRRSIMDALAMDTDAGPSRPTGSGGRADPTIAPSGCLPHEGLPDVA